MSQVIPISIILALALSLPVTATPLLIGLWILILALVLAAWISTLSLSWFRIILFLIYVRGILVIFAYFVAITPNQTIPSKYLKTSLFFLTLACFLTVRIQLIAPINFSNDTHFPIQQYLFTLTQRQILIFLVVLLFLAIVLAVKISDRSQGPLRPFH
jgi:hypothetical protein